LLFREKTEGEQDSEVEDVGFQKKNKKKKKKASVKLKPVEREVRETPSRGGQGLKFDKKGAGGRRSRAGGRKEYSQKDDSPVPAIILCLKGVKEPKPTGLR